MGEASTGGMEKGGKQEVGISLYVGILVAVCVGVHIPDMEMPNIQVSMPDFGFAVPEMPDIGANMPEMPAMPSMPEMPSLNPAELVQEGYNKAIEGVHEMKDSIVETLETVGQVVMEPLEKAWTSEESPEVESMGETESTESVADAIEEVKNIEEIIVAVESNIENETLSEATQDEEIVTDMEVKHEDNIDTDNSEDVSEELGNIEPNDSAVESTIAEVTETVVDTIEDVGSIEEHTVTAESAIEEPIVTAESAIEEPIVTAESAIEELTFTEATHEEIIVDALEPEANEESLNSDMDKSADKSEHLTEDESLEVVLVDEVDDTNIVGENSVETEQEGDMKTEESVGIPVDIITEDEAVPLQEKVQDIEEIKENSENKEESIVSSESKDTSENSLEVDPSLEIKSGG